MRRSHALMIAVALMLVPATSNASPTTFTATLTQGLEVPPTGSTATGSATIVLDPAANTLSVQVTFNGLTSGTTAAHIHCCLSSIFQQGINVGVATTTPTFAGFPSGVTAGTYNRVLDLTLASSYNPAFITAQGGSVAAAEAELIRGIQNGETYLNIHTSNFPGGEIRGFLVASPAPARLSLLKIIPIPVTPQNPNGGMFTFDIGFVDPSNGLYYLADRSNQALDVIDTTGAFTGKADSFFGQIGGPGVGFAGFTGSNDTSGPDGVVAIAFSGGARCVFAGDGPSRLVAFNFTNGFPANPSSVMTTLNTGGTTRVDEMAVSPTGVLFAINNAESPPFGTLVTIDKSNCAMSNPIKVSLGNLGSGLSATNGAEQPAWDPVTQRFYISIPEVNGPGGGGINGGVAKVNPTTGAVEAFFPINYCQPAGLTVGPNGDLLVGCNTVFDLNGNACVSAALSPAGQNSTVRKALCTGVAYPQAAICNPSKGCTGSSLIAVPGVGGGDEVWYNAGDGNYYITAGNNPGGASLGVVQSVTNVVTQVLPTLPPVGAKVITPSGTIANVSGTAHSVAASAGNNHVYVPLPQNSAYVDSNGNNCAKGCVAVFSAQ